MAEEIKEQTDSEAFDQAFEEATTVEEEPTKIAETEQLEAEPQKPVEPAPTGEPAPEKDSEPADQEDWKARADAAEQKMKSWEGRINAANKRAEEAERRLQEKESPTQAKEPSALPGGEEDEILNVFIKDYPTLEKPIAAMARRVASEIVAERMKKLEPEMKEVRETLANSTTRDHFSTIRAAHPDFDQIVNSGNLNKWVESQPDYLKPTLQRIVESGSTSEVVGMFKSYKDSLSTPSSETPNRTEPKIKKVESLLAVPGQTGGPSPGKKQLDKDDFDSAWNEALSAKKK